MKVKVQTLDGAQTKGGAGGDIELNDEIFAVEPRAVLEQDVAAHACTACAPGLGA